MAVVSVKNDDGSASEKEKEKARLQQELEARNLKELMALQGQLEKKGEETAAVLHAVRQGDLSVLKPYIKHETEKDPLVTLSAEDAQRTKEILSRGNIRKDLYVLGVPPEKAQQVLEANRKILRETFPTLNTEVMLVKSDSGQSYVQILGISFEEVQAALRLKDQQQKMAKQSQAVNEAIQHKISQPSGQAAGTHDDPGTITLAHTPPQKNTDARNNDLSPNR
jgi:hypothetical protein